MPMPPGRPRDSGMSFAMLGHLLLQRLVMRPNIRWRDDGLDGSVTKQIPRPGAPEELTRRVTNRIGEFEETRQPAHFGQPVYEIPCCLGVRGRSICMHCIHCIQYGNDLGTGPR